MLSSQTETLAEISTPILRIDLKKRNKQYILVTHREEGITLQHVGTDLRKALNLWNDLAERATSK